MKTRIVLSLAGVALLAVAGCRTSMNTIENAQKEGQRQMISDSRVITDSSLARKVSFVGINQTMKPGGVLRFRSSWRTAAGRSSASPTDSSGLTPTAWKSKTSCRRDSRPDRRW